MKPETIELIVATFARNWDWDEDDTAPYPNCWRAALDALETLLGENIPLDEALAYVRKHGPAGRVGACEEETEG